MGSSPETVTIPPRPRPFNGTSALLAPPNLSVEMRRMRTGPPPTNDPCGDAARLAANRTVPSRAPHPVRAAASRCRPGLPSAELVGRRLGPSPARFRDARAPRTHQRDDPLCRSGPISTCFASLVTLRVGDPRHGASEGELNPGAEIEDGQPPASPLQGWPGSSSIPRFGGSAHAGLGLRSIFRLSASERRRCVEALFRKAGEPPRPRLHRLTQSLPPSASRR